MSAHENENLLLENIDLQAQVYDLENDLAEAYDIIARLMIEKEELEKELTDARLMKSKNYKRH